MPDRRTCFCQVLELNLIKLYFYDLGNTYSRTISSALGILTSLPSSLIKTNGSGLLASSTTLNSAFLGNSNSFGFVYQEPLEILAPFGTSIVNETFK